MHEMYKKCAVISNGCVIDAYDLGNGRFIQVSALLDCEPNDVFETKFDAMYAFIVRRLQNGIPLSNYKASKYYNAYVNRLKIEHPEYII